MNTTETAGTTPATDGQIFARLKELSARATEIVGSVCGVGACVAPETHNPYWVVQDIELFAGGYGDTFEAACAATIKNYNEIKQRREIEARVRAEMEKSA